MDGRFHDNPARGVLQARSTSSEMTESIGRRLGRVATAGSVIGLKGDLGSGKTTFARGVARGVGVPADCPVTSPSYAIIHEYRADLPLVHIDLYRISHEEELSALGFDEILEGESLVLIEWADRMADASACLHLTVSFRIVSDHEREIRFEATGLRGVNLVKALETLCEEQLWV